MFSRLRQYVVVLTIFQLCVACDSGTPGVETQNEESADELAKEETGASCALVVAFGDSLFAGYQLGPNEGFVPRLERELRTTGLDVAVHNAAVSGDTSAAGRQRLAFMLDGLERRPDLVLVELGANDMLRGLEPAQTRDNLTTVLEELDRRGIDAILVGMLAAPNMGDEYAEEFNAIYPALADRFDVPLYPFALEGVIGDPSLLLADGIHPNASGVDVMVDRLSDKVADNLKSCEAG